MKKENLLVLIVICAGLAVIFAGLALKNQFFPAKSNFQINLAEPKNEENPFQGKIMVHLSGAVKNPGVYQIKSGSRLLDLLKLAGGAQENADLDALNLAKNLEDGQKILVPAKKKMNFSLESSGTAGNLGKINLNTAGPAELEKLSGIGPELAKKIITYREKNGSFSEINDLRKVGGLGDKKIEKIKEEAVCY